MSNTLFKSVNLHYLNDVINLKTYLMFIIYICLCLIVYVMVFFNQGLKIFFCICEPGKLRKIKLIL